jgi:hypothetical protein
MPKLFARAVVAAQHGVPIRGVATATLPNVNDDMVNAKKNKTNAVSALHKERNGPYV